MNISDQREGKRWGKMGYLLSKREVNMIPKGVKYDHKRCKISSIKYVNK